jgi:hypothetical protein
MLAGQPLAATIGFGTKAHIVTPLSMDLNGNGITVSNEIWEMMKPNMPKWTTAVRSTRSRPSPEAGGRKVHRRRQALQHGHGLPGLDAQLRAALLARVWRYSPGLLFRDKGDISGQIRPRRCCP